LTANCPLTSLHQRLFETALLLKTVYPSATLVIHAQGGENTFYSTWTRISGSKH